MYAMPHLKNEDKFKHNRQHTKIHERHNYEKVQLYVMVSIKQIQ